MTTPAAPLSAAASQFGRCIAAVELERRPSHPPDYAAESQALVALTAILADTPARLFAKLAETALELCQADSAGVSLRETSCGTESISSVAMVGTMADGAGQPTADAMNSCRAALEAGTALLLTDAAPQFGLPSAGRSRTGEALLVPFQCSGQPAGVLWILSPTDTRRFDREDLRLAADLAQVAGVAYQLTTVGQSVQAGQRALRRLHDASSRLWRVSNLGDGLDEMLAATIELLQADKGNVQLYHSTREVLLIAAQRGFESPFLEHFREVSTRDDAACGRALRTGARILIEDVETDEPFAPHRPVARAAGYRAVQSTPLVASDGRPLGMLSTHWSRPHRPSDLELQQLDLYARQAADFIERCQAEQALSENERRLQEAQRVGQIGSWEWDPATDRNVVTHELWRIFGLPLGQPFPDFREQAGRLYPHSVWVRLNTVVEEALRSGRGCNLEVEAFRGTEPIWVNWRSEVVRDAAGKIRGLRGTLQDITERKRIELKLNQLNDSLDQSLAERSAALRASEERLRLAVHATSLGLWDWNLQTNAVYFNPEYLAQLGYADGELRSDFEEWERRVHPDDLGAVLERIQRTLTGVDLPHETEFRMRHRDGTWRWIQAWADVHRDAAGVPVRMVGTHLDVTRRKQAEAAVQSRNAQLRAILDGATDAIVTIDYAGRIQSVNPATERLFGCSAADLVGGTVQQLIAEPFRDTHDGAFSRYRGTGMLREPGRVIEGRGRRKDGTEFPIELVISEVPALRQLTGFIRDISQRKALERQVVEISTLEQQRIGQDLHDELGQQLSALGLLAGSVSEVLREAAPDHVKLAERMESVACSALRSVRTIATGLVTGELGPQGLPQALAELCHRLDETSSTRFEFQRCADVTLSQAAHATHLFHIAQEACTNVLKHASATRVQITLEVVGSDLVLRIADDGQGLPASSGKKGLGLRIMQNRARLIGATVEVGSGVPGGTVVTCRLPRKDTNDR